MTPSREELLAVVRKYYESSNEFLYTSETSPETKRRHALWTQRIENMGPWKAFRARLRSELPKFNTGETGSTADGALRCMVYPLKDLSPPTSNWVVVGCVSILAPVYFVYGVEYDYIDGRLQNHKASFEQPPPSMVLPAQVVAKTIETTFGFSAVPHEIAETPVPLFVNWREPSEATLFHALFTSDPSIIP
jgi:hypothetical protein